MTNIEWFAPRMTGKELTTLKAVLDSGFVNDGAVTNEFERQIATVAGTTYAVAVTSGTAAITLALMACGLNLGDDVIVPDLTFIATANAVKLAGGHVILADVDRQNFCLTVETVAAVKTRKTKFVVAVEVNGRSPAYRDLLEYCQFHGLVLITDSCEALCSGHYNQALGSIGEAGCFSFSPNKIITTGQGGMVVTNNLVVYNRLRELKDQGRGVRGTGGNDVHPVVGFNFKFTDLQAAVGLSQLKVFEERIRQACVRSNWYYQALSGLDIECPLTRTGEVCLWTDILVDERFNLAPKLRDHGIGVREFWFPLHKQRPYARNTAFPMATDISRRGIWLPSGFGVTEAQVDRVASCIRKELH